MPNTDKPNVIVIVSDTYRPDHIGANGNRAVVTPELDAWLDRTITFDRALVSSFPTIPMRTDWFTGRFGCTRHGWRDLDRKAITLPHILKGSGYTTQLIADTTHMLRAGFWRPFSAFHFERGHEADTPFTRLNEPIARTVNDRRKTRVEPGMTEDRPTLCDRHAHTNFRQRYEDEGHAPKLAGAICRWIEDNYRGGPFMLWADFFDVHEPWYPPQYLLDLYDPEYVGEPMAHPNYASAEHYSAAELANMQARYQGMCTMLSKSVGRIFRLLDDTGLLDNTLVVFMSDHGMLLGERGRTGKTRITSEGSDNFPFYPEISRICWSMHVPPSLGLTTAAPGVRLDEMAQAPDLLPTVLELCGVEVPAEAAVEGRSLVPWLTGDATERVRELAVTAGTMGDHVCRMPAITDGRWTLMLQEQPRPAAPMLFDEQADPGLERNVFGEHREEAVRLHRAFCQWLADHDAGDAAERLFNTHAAGLG
jgi:arylsulfatase A-like enzyme